MGCPLSLVEAFEDLTRTLPADAEFAEVEIVAHRARRNGRNTELTLMVDRPGGVDLALCERIAARINAALESQEDHYTLEVESAGLDRPLFGPADYERFRDRDVLVKTTLPIASDYTHAGRLLGMRGNALVLQTKTGELPIPCEMVKSANLAYDYRADLRRAKKEKRER